MKKNYIIPNAKIIDISSEGELLSNSPNGNEGQIGGEETGVQESNRRNSIWDED